MSEIILRPDQANLKYGIYNGWQSGNRYMLGVLPTGGGKSIIVSDIAKDKNDSGSKQAVIAHRTELISQMSLHIANRGIQHQIIGPKDVVSSIVAEHRREFGRSFINPTANCAVAGVDTLIARQENLKSWAKQIDFWTIDEAHHVLVENKWGRAVTMFPNAYGLGVTATPQRADGKGLGAHSDGVFNDMVIGPSPRELMDIGAITDYEYVIPHSDFIIDEDKLAASGDFSPQTMRSASDQSHLVGDVVNEYIKHAYGKRGICFAIDVKDAKTIAANFNLYGIPAVAISALTPTEVRAEYIRRFRAGTIWILVNVDLFGEGFDVPAVEVVILARPTASLSVYLQQCGRALRTMAGKQYGLIIDHVSNFKRHGWPDKARLWSLDRREKRGKSERDPEEIPLTSCRTCSKGYERALPVCPHCGAEPVIVPGGRSDLTKIDGDLILLDRAKLAELRAAAELESPASMGERVAYAAGPAAAKRAINNQIERIQAQQNLEYAIAMWAAHQRAKGRDDQQSYRRFYLTTGVDVLSALAASRDDMNKLAEKINGWME